MPITNPEEIDTLSPLGEVTALCIHEHIKENITITDNVCLDKPDSHEGLVKEDGTCFECFFKAKYGVSVSLAARTFLQPETSPWNYHQFIGRFDPEDWGSETIYAKGCVRCGLNLRYAEGNNSLCVFCCGMMLARDGGWQEMERWAKQANHSFIVTNHYDRFLRDIAAGKGETFYRGKPCDKHGPEVLRYSGNGRCAECVRETNAEYQFNKKAAASNPAAASDFDSIFD